MSYHNKTHAMKALHLHRKKGTSYPTLVWYPADNESQLIALMHFSGGHCAVSDLGLPELICVAGMHRWEVSTGGETEKES